jgi:hypothetical protein
MSERTPLVSVGLPVYNGERYLEQAIDSLLAQDLADFELIICDNASEDGTAEIARGYAAGDDRVRYHRNPRNLGLVRNFNRVFELSQGRYFMWAAHDDWHAGHTLSACAEVLDGHPEAALCASAVAIADEDGTVFDEWHPTEDLRAPDPHARLHRLLWTLGEPHQLFGLMRADALRRTRLMGNYLGSDRVLLAELVLAGPIWYVPDILHYYRAPRLRPAELGPPPDAPRPSVVLDPANRERVQLRTWRLCYEHLRVVAGAPIDLRHKPRLLLEVLARFGVRDGRRAAAELYHAGRVLAAGRRGA